MELFDGLFDDTLFIPNIFFPFIKDGQTFIREKRISTFVQVGLIHPDGIFKLSFTFLLLSDCVAFEPALVFFGKWVLFQCGRAG